MITTETQLERSGLAADERVETPGGDWAYVAALLALALVLSTVPTLYAYLSTPPDRYFTGVVFNIPDHNQYFAWMRDLAQQNLAPNRLTSEPNEPALFHLLWWVAGRTGAALGATPGAVFGGLRVVALVSMLAAAFVFMRIAVPDRAQRRLAMLLFAFAGGLGAGWIVVKYLLDLPDAPFPFDIYTSEPNSFFIGLAFPHFGIALALLIGMIGLTLYAQQRQQLRYAVGAGLVGTLIGLQHAYDLLTIYTVLGLFGVCIWWRDRRFPMFLAKAAAVIAALTIPPAAYLSYLVLTDATWGGKLAQFDNAGAWTPNPLHLPILLGAPFFLALLAFRPRMLRSRSDAEILVAVWFLAHFVLAYLPVSFQIHLLLGWQVPITILAALALRRIVGPWLKARAPRLAVPALVGVFALCFVTSGYLLVWRVVDLGRHSAPYFLTQDEVAALRWLEQQTTGDDVVLGLLEINQHVPVWTDARAFLAHWAGTLDYYTKVELAAAVVDPATSPAVRQEVLRQHGVTYVIVRDADASRAAFAAAAGPGLALAYENATVAIYQVRRDTLRAAASR